MDKVLILIMIIIFSIFPLLAIYDTYIKEDRQKKRLAAFAEKTRTIPAEDFLRERANEPGDEEHMVHVSGVYVLMNETRGLYLTGQSVSIGNEVEKELTGGGNQALYEDFKAGDQFNVRLLDYDEVSFARLEELERFAIETFVGNARSYLETTGTSYISYRA